MHIVIVGNGVAGVEAARSLSEARPTWDVTLVSEESERFFARTSLVWVLTGQLRLADIEPLRRDPELSRGWRVLRDRALRLDCAHQQLWLAQQERPLSYDRLLLACGSSPVPPPWPGGDLPGVGHFVTLQDLAWLYRELHGVPLPGAGDDADADTGLIPHAAPAAGSPYRVRPSLVPRRGPCRRPCVIGGGLIGLELVEAGLAQGLPVDFVWRDDSFWSGELDPREAAWIEERLRTHGVRVHRGRPVLRIEADEEGDVARVHLEGQVLPCDRVLVAIGVKPNTDWLSGSGVRLDERGAVQVDAALQTSVPGVFAAGDCARLAAPEATATEPLWHVARAQGRAAGRSLAGRETRYDPGVPYNAARLMDLEYTRVGAAFRRETRAWFFEERGAVHSTLRVGVDLHGRIEAFQSLGRRWDPEPIQAWVRDRIPITYLWDHLQEASFDGEGVAPLRIPAAARVLQATHDGEVSA